ncbi:MAG: amidohydrolase family protein [Saprospiraceae bacterium]|nr:amidohydrolase family protein [Saprospiraceae bacterium]
MKKITADLVFPIASEPVENGVVITDDAGKILAVERREQHDPATLETHRGALIPGFVNTHCHLELSHMKGLVDTGTGLIPFITGVVTKRNLPAEVIADAIVRAEREMLEGGIVAVGDISNTTDTFAVKAAGRMRYYTFVELFDFLQDAGAEKAFADWKSVYDQLPQIAGSTGTLVPHAPYTVSKSLFQKINETYPPDGLTVSIHNQETPPENELFEHGKGAFYEFYGKFNISLAQFEPTGKPSLFYALANMLPQHRTLFVHNTLTTAADIRAAQAWSPRTFWATCPNANLYIENRLPDYRNFLETGACVTIGTDSLTSNWQLSILEELKTIARYQSYVPFDALLRWATLNGAQALGFDDTLGSLETGKTPGILLLQGLSPDKKIQAETTVKRLI